MGPFASHQGITQSPKNSKLKWIDETTEDNNPEETKNLRTNPSELDLCLKSNPAPIVSHKKGVPDRSIIKVKQSQYQLEADPVI